MAVPSSPPYRCSQRTNSRANPLPFNILNVSTFTFKILSCIDELQANEFKDLAILPAGAAFKQSQNRPLTPTLSRFYVQLLWIQRFFPCLSAKLMITKDHRERGYIPRERVEPKIAALTLLPSIFYQQLLWIQRFCSCSHANPMIPKDHGERGYTHFLRNTF